MIDLHCHILPSLDDGPATTEASLALARRAVELGVRTAVATPHVSWLHPFEPASVGERAAALEREPVLAMSMTGLAAAQTECPGGKQPVAWEDDETTMSARVVCV